MNTAKPRTAIRKRTAPRAWTFVQRPLDLNVLTPRERQIVSLVAQGFQNRAIAQKLVSSEQTVKNHLHNVFKKLEISDRLELALYVTYTGWEPPT